MFYCMACKDKKGWPEALFKSYGTCEVCGKTSTCNEMKSKNLLRPIPNEDEEECK